MSQGVSRSASVVIAYLIATGSSYAEAYRAVETARPCIRPNQGFVKALKTWEKSCREREILVSKDVGDVLDESAISSDEV